MTLWILLLCGISASIAALIIWLLLREKSRKIKLKCLFLPTNLEHILNNFKQLYNIEISGILGNDFFKRYKYIIDYKSLKIKHGQHSMSIKETVDIVGMPLIVLWQNKRKYIFIVDTGSTHCHISKKALETMEYTEQQMSHSIDTSGLGADESSNFCIKAILYYR